MIKKNISPLELLRAEKIFKDKGWEMGEETQNISQYEGFLSRVSILPKDTKNLFFDLTERFDNIHLNDIIGSFKESFKKIDIEIIDQSRKIYFLPLIIPIIKNENKYRFKFLNILLNFFNLSKRIEIERPKHKSCDFMLSLLKIEYRDMHGSHKFLFPTSYLKFKQQYDSEKDLLVFVDDFVGTGDTANNVLNFFIKEEKLIANRIKIITVISQKIGVERIYREHNVSIYSNIEKNKAITDFYDDADTIQNNKNLVTKMSEKINIKKDFFGYKDSEALVCILNKSPNNTFPIFWFENNKNLAPFPRMKIYNNKNIKKND